MLLSAIIQNWFQISFINNDTLRNIPIPYKFLSNFKHVSFFDMYHDVFDQLHPLRLCHHRDLLHSPS